MLRFLPVISLLLPLVTVALPEPQVQAQTSSRELIDEVRVNGLVIDRRKYSFTLQALDRTYQVVIPNGTPILMKLNKPQIDWQSRTISLTLMLSAADGDPANDQVLSWPLADPVYVSTTFRDQAEKQRILEQQVRELDRFLMSSQPFARTSMTFGGELEPSSTAGQFFLNDNGGVYAVKLGMRRGLLADFSIMDLRPLETSVWVQGAFDGDTVVASRIRFEYIGDPTAGFNETLPNLLTLGDVTSYEYHRPLVEALAGKANVHHPPTWTGPSNTWDRLHHYVGQLDNPGNRTWDVIVFNYGVRDDTESRENYQGNLRNAVRLLQRTGAKLVWVNSTPIPKGYPAGDPSKPLTGRVQGRMDLQNHWAATVMAEFPDVAVCDLWQVVKDGENERYEKWWTRELIHFDYDESIPLGREVARSALQALGSDVELNPMSVHGARDSLSSSR